jgi:hypothetical protein
MDTADAARAFIDSLDDCGWFSSLPESAKRYYESRTAKAIREEMPTWMGVAELQAPTITDDPEWLELSATEAVERFAASSWGVFQPTQVRSTSDDGVRFRVGKRSFKFSPDSGCGMDSDDALLDVINDAVRSSGSNLCFIIVDQFEHDHGTPVAFTTLEAYEESVNRGLLPEM